MILVLCLLSLLVSTNTGAVRIKGGPRIVQEPSLIQDVSQPHLHYSKTGRGASLHHTAVVQDPVSQDPVVVEKVTSIGSPAGFGPSSGQFSLDDSQIRSYGQRRLYRVGQSQVPFGLSGLDYYSYPNYLLSPRRRVLRRKTVGSDNVSGLRPVGFATRKGGAIAVDPISQFSVADAQINTGGFGRRLYRTGLSPLPYGLTGLDYYSYPKNLLTRRRIIDDGFGQRSILTSGPSFTAGDSQVRGIADPLGQEKVTIVESAPSITPVVQTQVIPQQVAVVDDGDFGQRQVTTTTVTRAGGGGLDPLGFGQRQLTQTTVTRSAGSGLRGGQFILRGAQGIGGVRRIKTRPIIRPAPVNDAQLILDETSGLGAPIGGFGQRQVTTITRTAGDGLSSIAQAPVVVAAPSPIVQAPIRRRIISRRPGEVFLTQVARPRVAQRRVATIARPAAIPIASPLSQQRVVVQETPSTIISTPVGPANIQFALGGSQLVGGPIAAQTPIVVSRPQVISQVRTDAGLIGSRLFSRRIPQMLYVDGSRRFPGIDIIGGSRIGDPRYNYIQLPISTGRFANLGGLSQARIPVQSFSSPVTKTVAKTISQPAAIGLTPVGLSAPANVVTQEEVIGPAGDRQVVTTVTKSGPSKIGGAALGGPLGFTAVGQAPTAVVTQEEAIGPAGDRQVVTTVTKAAPSKIGGAALGGPLGLTAVGQTRTAVVTQEESIGPAGDRQVVTTVTKAAPSKIGGAALGGPLGFTAVGQAPTAVVTQEESIGPAGDRQVVTTVTKAAPSKIGGAAFGGPLGLAAVGQARTAVVTQEESIGPAGDRQVVTTVTKAAPSKIGGAALGGPLGFTAVGQAPAAVVTQEESIGPAGDRQVVTTVTKAAPSKIGGAALGGPLGLTAVGQTPTAVVTQEESIGPAGDRQVVTTVTKAAQSKIGGVALGGPLGLTAVGQSPAAVVTQEESIGPAGDRQVVTTVTKASPSKIGGAAFGGPLGFTAVGQAPTAVVTQEESIGPAGDRQVVTTVTKASPSKIGGAALGGRLGLTAVGHSAPTKVITQEEVVGPAGDTQAVVTTVTKTVPDPIVQQEEVVGPIASLRTTSALSQEIAQDPIETAIAQEALGDAGIISSGSSLLSPFSQSAVDPIGIGQTRLGVDDVIAQSPFSDTGSGVTRVKETTFTEPGLGGSTVTKVTEVSQQPVVQQSIADDLDGGLGFLPRISFLNRYPYDVPDSTLLRSILTRPVVQEQQELEQILV